MDISIFSIIDNVSNKWMMYLPVAIVLFYMMVRSNFSLTRFAFIVIIAIIVLFYDKHFGGTKKKMRMKKRQEEINDLFPENYEFDDSDITHFIFMTKDFYKYNQQAYQEMIDNIVVVTTKYKKLLINDDDCEQIYDIVLDKKRNAINSLHSIIYSLPVSRLYTDKLNKSIKDLDKILGVYIDKIKNICRSKLEKGYNIDRRHIHDEKHPVAYNTYTNDIGTFDVF